MLKDIYEEKELETLSESELELLSTLNTPVQELDEDKDQITVLEYIEDEKAKNLEEAKAKKEDKSEEDDKSEDDDKSEEDDDKSEEDDDKSEEDDDKSKEKKEDVEEASDLISESKYDDNFKAKAAELFKTELDKKVAVIKEDYDSRLELETIKYQESLAESADQVDSYMQHVVDEWMVENKLEFEGSVRTGLSESFMNSIRDVFTENYIEVPEAKLDLFAELEAEKNALQESFDDAQKANEALTEGVCELKQDKLLSEACDGLASTQVVKLQQLAEKLDYVSDTQYSSKLETLKEFYFNKDTPGINEELDEDVEIVIEEEEISEDLTKPNGDMSKYLSAMGRQNHAAKTADVTSL